RQVAEQQLLLAASELRELELQHKLEMSESEARFSDIVGTAMDAIIVFDADGKVSMLNAAAERMFGMATDGTGEQNVRQIFPEAEREQVLERISGACDVEVGANEGRPDGHTLSFTG